MTKLEKIVKEAQKIRKAHPKKYAKWTDYIKAASKSIAGYVGTKKTATTTTVNYTRKVAAKKAKPSTQAKLFGVKNKTKALGEYFDTSIIKDIDGLKKQYFKLAKKFHPDAGGTTLQFQQLQQEYEKLLSALLKGSNFTTEQKDNEIELDKAMRGIIDALVNIDGIVIDLIGKWLWISGNTYPVRTILKSVGLVFIKKDDKAYWVYKGVESKSKGGTTMEQIINKYGSKRIEVNPNIKKIISGVVVGSINPSQKMKLKANLKRAIKALNKRPI